MNMSGIDKAVILAAGLGNRISAVAKDTPKPLLPLDGQKGSDTFLDWHVRSLADAGVKSQHTEIVPVARFQVKRFRYRQKNRALSVAAREVG